MSSQRRFALLDLGWTFLLTVVLLGPMLWRRGYVLRGDMVFVPDQPWKQAWLGLDGSVPRFVPGEAMVWALGQVASGDVVQKVLLASTFLVAGMGMSVLARDWTLSARWTAVAAFLWNPWTFERLAIGQWPLLVGYATLPWIVHEAQRLRTQPSCRSIAPILLWTAVAAASSPTSGLLALAVALVVVSPRGTPRQWWATLGGGVLWNLPWLVPALLALRQPIASPDQFAAFGVRGETWLGPVASVVSLGGIWKEAIVPPERTVPLIVALAGLVCVAGAVALATRAGRLKPVAGPLLGLATGLLVLVCLGAVPWVAGVSAGAAERIPGLALFRDSHRLLAPWGLVVALGVGLLVDGIHRIGSATWREGLRVVVVVGPLVPILLLPSFAWGMNARLTPVAYPPDWYEVQRLPPAVTVVLPWHGTYRGYAWNNRTAILDPAPRMFPGVVLIDDRHYLDGGVVLASEDPVLGRVAEALDADDPSQALRDLGVARVIVEHGNGVVPEDVPDGRTIHEGPWLSVVDLGEAQEFTRAGPPVAVVLLVDLLVLGSVVLLALRLTVRPRQRSQRKDGRVES